MKHPNLHIAIPTPCSKRWDDMHASKEGRHCDFCSKTVVDFTNHSDTEIIEYIIEHSTSVCGRVNIKDIDKPHFNPSFLRKLGISILAFIGLNSLFSTNKIWAQTVHKNEIALSKKNDSTSLVITGVVRSQQKHSPIDFANVSLLKNNKTIATILTDSNGHFTLEVPNEFKNDTLVLRCSYLGFKSSIITNLSSKESMELVIYLDERSDVLMGDVIIKQSKPMVNPNGVGGKTFDSNELKRMGY